MKEELRPFVYKEDLKAIEEYMVTKGLQGEFKLLKGLKEIAEFQHSVDEKFLQLNEDYNSWNYNGQVSSAGKLLIVGKGTFR